MSPQIYMSQSTHAAVVILSCDCPDSVAGGHLEAPVVLREHGDPSSKADLGDQTAEVA